MQLFSKAKHSLTAMAQKEVCPRDEIADPPGTAMLPIDKHGFAGGLVSFRTLCGVQSAIVSGEICSESCDCLGSATHSGRHRKRLCVSALRSPELSAQVRRPNSSTSYRQGYMVKESPCRRSRNFK